MVQHCLGISSRCRISVWLALLELLAGPLGLMVSQEHDFLICLSFFYFPFFWA
ncbi:hypothetical protein M6B38_305280 [Iris pallida]|uniref:Uncharacterized protein n=1 Tax=Iris pallida TaxID=29817 RepID=A0AAX6HM20_IRIPA|nr:hypothetical protein M6B38_305280 [Iris pallida]